MRHSRKIFNLDGVCDRANDSCNNKMAAMKQSEVKSSDEFTEFSHKLGFLMFKRQSFSSFERCFWVFFVGVFGKKARLSQWLVFSPVALIRPLYGEQMEQI